MNRESRKHRGTLRTPAFARSRLPPAGIMPNLHDYIDQDTLRRKIAEVRFEDLGPGGVDVTGQVFIPADTACEAQMNTREAGVLAGAALLPMIAAAYDPAIVVEPQRADGDALAAGDTVATFRGALRSVLAMERIALNFATHLSGVATRTAAFVARTAGSAAAICDTRKTLPGLRALQKYAVACGGGTNHRIGLYDAMLIKDNHLAHLAPGSLHDVLAEAVARARTKHPELAFIEVEVDTLDQLEQVLDTGIDLVLLDNMSPETLARAVAMRDQRAPQVKLEASGGVTLETVAAIAATGVERISVGGLTHSAPSLDLGLDIRER